MSELFRYKMIESDLELNSFGCNEIKKGIALSDTIDFEKQLEKALVHLTKDFARVAIVEGIEPCDFKIEVEEGAYGKQLGVGLFARYKMSPNPFTAAYKYLSKLEDKNATIKKYEEATFWTRLKWLFTGVRLYKEG